jgi:DNA-binding MarR family transcriptional regulator
MIMWMQVKLTSKERIVLYGLARYPGLSDIDLASKIGVDRSTIFKSKRKFRDSQLIKLLNVPSGMAVGAEILTVVFAKFKPIASQEVRDRERTSEKWLNHPNCVFHISSNTDSVSMLYFSSLTDFRSSFDPLIDDFRDKNFIDDLSCIHYPFQLTDSSYDVASAVNTTFDLERTDVPNTIEDKEAAARTPRFTEKDKLVLYAFVKYPGLSDLELSRRTGISRPTISGKRNKFFQNGMLSREAYIDWEKLGCELLSFFHINVRPKAMRSDLLDVHNSLRRIGAPLFSLFQPGSAMGSFLSHSYPELKRNMDIELRALAEQGLIDDGTRHVIIPLREIKVKKINYSPMVREMLGIGKDI